MTKMTGPETPDPRGATTGHPLQGWCIRRLLEALDGASYAAPAEVSEGLDWLERVVGSLPLTTEEFGFASNWVRSARSLWERGEPGAARYQVVQVGRKLDLI